MVLAEAFFQPRSRLPGWNVMKTPLRERIRPKRGLTNDGSSGLRGGSTASISGVHPGRLWRDLLCE